MIDGRFKRCIPIIFIIAPGEAIMVAHRFIRIIGGDIMRMYKAMRQRGLHCHGMVISIEIPYDDSRTGVFFLQGIDACDQKRYLVGPRLV